MINEIEGLQFNQTMLVKKYTASAIIYFNFIHSNDMSVLVDGSDILDSQGFSTDWLWYNQIGLAGMCVIFLTLAYITLRAIKKEK